MSKGISSVFLIKLTILAALSNAKSEEYHVDPQGYVVYCPCMGEYY